MIPQNSIAQDKQNNRRVLRDFIGFNTPDTSSLQLHVESRELLSDLEYFINSMFLSYWSETNSDVCREHIFQLLNDTELYNHYQYIFYGEDTFFFGTIYDYMRRMREELEGLKSKWESCLQNRIVTSNCKSNTFVFIDIFKSCIILRLIFQQSFTLS